MKCLFSLFFIIVSNVIFSQHQKISQLLDIAFERRFLFKLPFKKPTKKVRAKIWKSKLPHLDDESCQILAEKFDLSGGQIDNVIRKSEIQEIVHGTMANLEQIQAFCNEEYILTKTTKIGFGYAHDKY